MSMNLFLDHTRGSTSVQWAKEVAWFNRPHLHEEGDQQPSSLDRVIVYSLTTHCSHFTLLYSLLRASHSNGGSAEPLACVPQLRDMAVGLPGTHSTSGGAVRRVRPY
jgi:hypothetical protein